MYIIFLKKKIPVPFHLANKKKEKEKEKRKKITATCLQNKVQDIFIN